MDQIKVIPFSKEHVCKITELEALCFVDPWSQKSFEDELNNDIAVYLVAVNSDGIPVGYGGYWHILDEAHITNIAVSPVYQKMGIGDSIINEMEKLWCKQGIIAATLEVRFSNIPAQKLYTKHGFVNKGLRKKYYMDNKEDAIIMWRNM